MGKGPNYIGTERHCRGNILIICMFSFSNNIKKDTWSKDKEIRGLS